jgi:hypothetical protein
MTLKTVGMALQLTSFNRQFKELGSQDGTENCRD